MYIDYIMNLLKDKGCIINNELNMSKFEICLKTNIINCELFNKPLWGEFEELDF